MSDWLIPRAAALPQRPTLKLVQGPCSTAIYYFILRQCRPCTATVIHTTGVRITIICRVVHMNMEKKEFPSRPIKLSFLINNTSSTRTLSIAPNQRQPVYSTSVLSPPPPALCLHLHRAFISAFRWSLINNVSRSAVSAAVVVVVVHVNGGSPHSVPFVIHLWSTRQQQPRHQRQ